MSPDELAQMHSAIIDGKLADLKELFKSVNIDTAVKIETLFKSLEVDDNGKVMKSASNRKILNAAVGIIKRKTATLRPVVFNQYLEAVEQIDKLATDYIVGLKSDGQENR